MSEYQKNGVLGTEQSTSNKVRISGRWTSPNAGSAYVFPGLIDEVKIYNYARTPAQIKADYENTKAYFPGGSSSPAFVGADCISPQSGTCDVPLQFDGVDDYLTLGPGTIGRELSGAVASSVSMWIKPVSFPTAGNNFQLIGAVINGAYAGPVDYKINADHTIAVGGRSTGADSHQNLNSIGTINANEWTHILGVLNFTGDSITIYINGNLDNTSAKTFGSNTYSPGTPSGPDMIGNFYNTSRFFKGSIAGVKIFDYALSADQVKTQYASGIDGSGAGSGGSFGEDSGEARLAPTDGLVGHWKLDGDANDASGNSNNGILYGDTTFTSGKLGQAGSFDGTGDYVSVADSTSLRITSGGLTLSGWMTMNNFTNGSMIFYKGEIANGNAGNYNFRVNSDRTIDFLFYDGVGVNKYWRSTSAVYPNDSNYHFISLSHQWGNGSSTKIYVDGVQVSGSWVSGTGNETPLANTDILTLL